MTATANDFRDAFQPPMASIERNNPPTSNAITSTPRQARPSLPGGPFQIGVEKATLSLPVVVLL